MSLTTIPPEYIETHFRVEGAATHPRVVHVLPKYEQVLVWSPLKASKGGEDRLPAGAPGAGPEGQGAGAPETPGPPLQGPAGQPPPGGAEPKTPGASPAPQATPSPGPAD